MPGSKITFNCLQRQYKSIKDELLDAIDQVYSSGRMLDGPYVQMLEETIAYRVGRKHAVAVNSGTQALELCYRIIKLASHRDSVTILTPYSFVATLNSYYNVFGDQGSVHWCKTNTTNGLLDPKSLDQLRIVSNPEKDNFIINIVQLFGNCVNYEELLTVLSWCQIENFTIIEDAAQSFGSRSQGRASGAFGNLSILSFDPTKTLSNYGSGGMVLCDDEIYTDILRSMRDNNKLGYSKSGTNSKISEADAAGLIVKLNHFDDWQKRRQEIAEYYIDVIGQENVVMPADGMEEQNWHKFVLRINNREFVRDRLTSLGIETKIHYPKPLTHVWELQNFDTFWLGNKVLSLPIYPELTDQEVEYVAKSVKKNLTF
jgi:dTDP-4-amino-4,6-dideoxygalactose transaminase